MPYYNLWREADNQTFSKAAANRNQALAEFGADLGVRLTFEDTGGVPGYMFGESEDNVHWVKTDVPVFEQASQPLPK